MLCRNVFIRKNNVDNECNVKWNVDQLGRFSLKWGVCLCDYVGCRIVWGKKTRLQCSSLMVQRVSLRERCAVPDDAEIFNLLSLESDTKDNTQGDKGWYVDTFKMLVNIFFLVSFFSSLGLCFVNPGIGFSLPIDIQVPSLGNFWLSQELKECQSLFVRLCSSIQFKLV